MSVISPPYDELWSISKILNILSFPCSVALVILLISFESLIMAKILLNTPNIPRTVSIPRIQPLIKLILFSLSTSSLFTCSFKFASNRAYSFSELSKRWTFSNSSKYSTALVPKKWHLSKFNPIKYLCRFCNFLVYLSFSFVSFRRLIISSPKTL